MNEDEPVWTEEKARKLARQIQPAPEGVPPHVVEAFRSTPQVPLRWLEALEALERAGLIEKPKTAGS
jgi:hypothetical protein